MRHKSPVLRALHGIAFVSAFALAGCGGGGGGAGGANVSATELPAIPPAQIDAAIAQIDRLAADLMRRSGIPGMAVAVVKDGKTVYAKGFGVRRLGSPEKVDTDTVFQLASVSKSVGATAMATLVGAGSVNWDTRVASVMPDFKLANDAVTQQVTIGDFYALRSGLPAGAGDMLEVLGYDRGQILERLRYVSNQGFRTQYGYANFSITAGAQAAATAAGMDWETISEQNLYRPLGMASTSSRNADFMRQSNRASLHVKRGGNYQPLYLRQPDAQSPAGGVSSSVKDMARWLAMVLQNGVYEGRQVVKADALLPALNVQIDRGPADGVSARSSGYGYGFVVTVAPSGRVKLGHSGAFTAGASTSFSIMQSAGVAIVTLTNAMPVGVPEALNSSFDDLVEYGKVTRDWYSITRAAFEPINDPLGSLAGQTPPAPPVPALAATAYAGTYANSYFGDAVVEASAGNLTLKMGPGGVTVYPLRHWSGNTFIFDWSEGEGSLMRVDFNEASGVVNGVQIEAFVEDQTGGVFTRKR